MITRFSLYGFLKNMQFFEPFLILYFLSMGLSYLQIGMLVSFRAICVNILEIPSGAAADIYGRKSAMLFSLGSYILSFIIFSLVSWYPLLFAAMFFFSIGEAFRTGTHKAMIFDWLRHNDRLDERTKVYGFTRSWSKIGSAVSVIIASGIVILSNDYRWVFAVSIIPYCAGIWNMLCYPSSLNRRLDNGSISIKNVALHLLKSLKHAFSNRGIRGLIIRSTGFEGAFRVSRDYLQPIIRAQAVALTACLALSEKDGTAIIIGLVYFILYMISASASRRSWRFVALAKTEDRASVMLLIMAAATILTAAAGFLAGVYIVPIAAFIVLYLLQNLWRPILVSQFDLHAQSSEQATILSIESQAKSIGIIVLAPAAGFIADIYGIHASLAMLSLVPVLVWVFSRSAPAALKKQENDNHSLA